MNGGYILLIFVLISIILWYFVRLVKYHLNNKYYFKYRNSVAKRFWGWNPEDKKIKEWSKKVKNIEDYEKDNWEEVELDKIADRKKKEINDSKKDSKKLKTSKSKKLVEKRKRKAK